MNCEEFKKELDKRIGYPFLKALKDNELIRRLDGGTELLCTIQTFNQYRKQLKRDGSLDQNNPQVKNFFKDIRKLRFLIRLPQITTINSRNVFGFSLDFLRHLLIDKYLTKRFIFERCLYGLRLRQNELEELKLHFRASLIQALEYLNNAVKADITISPVLLYYALINFLYCYSLLKYEDSISDKKNKTHGVKTTKLVERDLFSSKLEIKSSSNIQPYLSYKGIGLTNRTYSVLDALKSINYLSTTLERFDIETNVLRIYDQSNDGLLSHATGLFPARISFDVKRFTSLTNISISTEEDVKQVKNYFLSDFREFLQTETVTIHECRLEQSRLGIQMGVIDFCPQYSIQKDIIEFLAVHRDHNGNKFLILENNTAVNDPIFHIYTSAFFLCDVSRYHPHIWHQFIKDEINKVVIERYVRSTAIFILYRFLTLLSGELVLFQ